MLRGSLWLAGLLVSRCLPGGGETPPELHVDSVTAEALSGDTVVTYRDSDQVVGAIVQDEHRLVLTQEQLPLTWQVAVVAAEDAGFWHHAGVSPWGLLRAVRDNLAAGRVVSGGSTITQQTIKNLVGRKDRTYRAKWRELDYAIHLEKAFTKSEILTFYSNVFHVTGTGSGLGVAARHFFDRSPEELSLLEYAFVAGQLHAPAAYQTFEGAEGERAAARERARARTTYVLRRIRDERASSLTPPHASRETVTALQREAARLLDEGFELPFRQGTFRYPSNTLVDEVQRRLQTPTFQRILSKAGVSHRAGGLTVTTTLDAELQREASWALRHRLTELGLRLERATVDDLFVEDVDSLPVADVWTTHAFGVGTVTKRLPTKELVVSVRGAECTVDHAALRRVAAGLGQGAWSVSRAIQEGDSLWVSLREPGHCDLEVVPELQGAAVVLERGRLRALVGGNTNRDFDRTRAPRQFGSAFKPLIFHAAMTLGWRPDDLLPNHVMPFRFSETVYEPRRGHEAPSLVTMARAATSSENVASVWLLVHLVDRLSALEVSELARQLDLAKRPTESDRAFHARLEQAGVELVPADLPDIATRMAATRYAATRPVRGAVVRRTVSEYATLAHLETLLDDCEHQVRGLREDLRRRRTPRAPALSVRTTSEGLDLACHLESDEFVPVETFFAVDQPRPAPPDPRLGARNLRQVRRGQRRRSATPTPRRAPSSKLPTLDLVYVGGSLRWGEIVSLKDRQATALRELQTRTNVYAPDVLHQHGDFRTLLALRYVQRLAARYGVQSELRPVLSLPLGSSELTLQELTTLYGGLVSGRATGSSQAPGGPNVLIREIRDRTGRVVYRARTIDTPVVDDSVGLDTAELLRQVVSRGTGRRARGAVEVDGIAVPIGGKTGTTNDYRNAAFVGYVPAAVEDGYDPGSGHIVGVYVGYDDNREMKGRGLHVGGSVGALPPFRDVAASIGGGQAPDVRPVDGQWPLRPIPGLATRAVGLVSAPGAPQG